VNRSFQIAKSGNGSSRPGDQDEIPTWPHFAQHSTGDLAKPAAHSVAHYSAPDAARNGKTASGHG
jgi:hypothetical protein